MSMHSWRLIALLFAAAGCARSPALRAPPAPGADDPPAAAPATPTKDSSSAEEPAAPEIAALRRRLGCDSLPTALCDGLAAFDGAQPPRGRPDPVALVGVSAIVPRSGSTDEGAPPVYEASYLVLSDSGARYGSVRPTSEAERRDVLAVVQTLLAGRAPPENDAVTFARSRTGTSPATRGARSLGWSGVTRGVVRETAIGVVVIETTRELTLVGWFPLTPHSNESPRRSAPP